MMVFFCLWARWRSEIAGGWGWGGKRRRGRWLKCSSERTILNLICLYNLTSSLPPVSSHFKPDKQTNTHIYLCMNALGARALAAHTRTREHGVRPDTLIGKKGTEVLHLSRRWNLEKWKSCICILICSQSGIVFGVAAKLPRVCSSSLFIGVLWETGTKFKSARYHSVWRWGILFFPSRLCLQLCLPLSLTLQVFIFHLSSFFSPLVSLPLFLIISPYFFPLPFFPFAPTIALLLPVSPSPTYFLLQEEWVLRFH